MSAGPRLRAEWQRLSSAAGRLRQGRHRWYRTMLLASAVGMMTGVGVSAFELVTDEVLHATLDGPLAWKMVAPGLGLLLATVVLRYVGHRASASTADEYIRAFHDRQRRLDGGLVPPRIAGAVATLGLGAPLGFEGPSVYLGASFGAAVQHRFSRFFAREDAKILLVAGAAAGVSAIFKAPATGAIFALEVPFQRDITSRAVLPALVSSASSYLAFVTLQGTTAPLLRIEGNPAFNAADIGGALLVGLLAGLGARGFASLLRLAKEAPQRFRMRWCIAGAGAGLAALVWATNQFYDEPFALGPGYDAITWAADPEQGLVAVAGLFLIRGVASVLAVGGGGVGGVFIPLVVQGALLGRLVGAVVPGEGATLFPLVGMAAFLGAGYRTPLAAVMFVAESTGRPGFVVPGLLATALAQLVMGRVSVSPYQHSVRAGHVERRLRLPISAGVVTDVYTCSAEATVEELIHVDFLAARAEAIPVVDGDRYLGMVLLADVARVPREERATRTAGEVMRDDLPIAHPSWSLRQAVIAMEEADVDRMAVIADNRLVGVITTDAIVQLDEILEETEDQT